MSTTSPTASQLLCACGVSYAIGTSNPAPEPYTSNAGFTNTPTPFLGPDTSSSACLFGMINSSAVIAFRGTVFTSVVDWTSDFLAAPEAVTGLTGMVHTGFYLSTMQLMPQILAALEPLLQANSALPIVITGHSKGGAMATLAAALLRGNNGIKASQITVTTFASPMTGNLDFANNFQSLFPTATNYINLYDIVPFLPPSKMVANDIMSNYTNNPIVTSACNVFIGWNYSETASVIQYISSSNQVNAGSNDGLSYLSYLHNIEEYLTSGNTADYKAILSAHSHACRTTGDTQSSYMAAVCGTICSS
jgi:Lipase (class 3)